MKLKCFLYLKKLDLRWADSPRSFYAGKKTSHIGPVLTQGPVTFLPVLWDVGQARGGFFCTNYALPQLCTQQPGVELPTGTEPLELIARVSSI